MATVEEAEQIIASLTPAEQARVLLTLVHNLEQSHPGIESTPGVCGGDPCIVRTRIPVWVLEQARRLGVSEVELLRNYPTLRAEDLANAWSYVLAHRSDIDEQIRQNESA